MTSRRTEPFLAPPRALGSTDPPAAEPRGDDAFDVLLSARERQASPTFWSPIAVAQRAAELFRKHGARRVLDVGSGPGKFCITAGRAAPDISFTGIEHRPHLVAAAHALARRLRLTNVTFRIGEATATSWDAFDGLYFFNPFGENLFGDPDDHFDLTVDLGEERFLAEIARAERRLAAAAIGVVVATYHGFGGCIPASFELVESERCGTNWLRVWRKREDGHGGTSGWRELYDGGVRRTRAFHTLRAVE